MIRKTGFAALCLSLFLLAGVAIPSQAESRDQCQERVRKAEENLRREVDRHGEHSSQAENRRRDLERQRQACRSDEHRDHHDDNNHHDDYDRH